MARKWKELEDKMGPERRARIRERVDRALLEMDLAELRQRQAGLTQAEVARLLGVTQGAISQLEKREDVLLSNLADYVRALGGHLELVVHFEDGDEVRITQFDGVKEQVQESRD